MTEQLQKREVARDILAGVYDEDLEYITRAVANRRIGLLKVGSLVRISDLLQNEHAGELGRIDKMNPKTCVVVLFEDDPERATLWYNVSQALVEPTGDLASDWAHDTPTDEMRQDDEGDRGGTGHP